MNSARGWRMKLWSVHNTVSLLLPSFHTFPLPPAWVFSMSPSWTVTVCVLPTRQVLQELLQCMCFPWGMVLQEQTAPHGSSMGLSPVRKTASVWVSAQTAVCISVLMWFFLASKGTTCFTMVFSTGYIESVLAFEAPPLTPSHWPCCLQGCFYRVFLPPVAAYFQNMLSLRHHSSASIPWSLAVETTPEH